MARAIALVVALAFIAFFGLLTALDIRNNGLSAADVVAIGVLLLFCTGIVGALRRRP